MELRNVLDWQIIPALKTVAGVDEIQAMGGDAKEYQVQLIPERLHGYHISASEVMAALSKNNMSAGGGYMVENDDQTLLRGEGMLHTVADIENVVLRRTERGLVKIKTGHCCHRTQTSKEYCHGRRQRADRDWCGCDAQGREL